VVSPKLVLVALLLLGAVPCRAQDAVPLGTVVFHGGAPDLAQWPATFTVTHAELNAANDIGFSFQSTPDRCPNDFIPPTPVNGVPWRGPIKYTVFAGFNLGGQVHLGGFVQMWPDRKSTGAPVLTDNNWQRNWAYDGRWGPLGGVIPQAGQTLYLLLVCGNGRTGQVPETAVRERSNLIAIPLPASGSGAWDFSIAPPVVPPPVTPPVTPPSVDLSGLATKADIERMMTYLQMSNDYVHQEFQREHESDLQFLQYATDISKAVVQLQNAGVSGNTKLDYINLATGLVNALATIVKQKSGATP
jgi:hypothetical protein